MQLPDSILSCMETLENASFPTYAVGGCVRDWLLGITPQDHDLCTAATPQQIQSVFSGQQLLLHGVKHGTVGVVMDGNVVEITTFRTEGGYADNRHPDWVEFVTDIESDLARRDFTVNAMAYSPTRGLCDPFGGKNDLKNKCLRAVGDPDTRFCEDALRILRGIRFAAKYRLTIEDNTWQAMLRQLPLTENLARERVSAELDKLLLHANADDLLRFAPILAHVIPELAPLVGFDQHSPHHAYDLYTHTAYVTAGVPSDLPLRWAALLHDIGKIVTFTQDENGRGHFYGHAKQSATMADAILHRLKLPTALREEAVWLIDQHMTALLPDKKLLRRRISRRSLASVERLLALQQADMAGKGTQTREDVALFESLQQTLAQTAADFSCLRVQDLAIGGDRLLELGFRPGPQMGRCLTFLHEQVVDGTLPNEASALSAAATAYLTQPPEDSQ